MLKTYTFHVSGTHCSACKILIEDVLKEQDDRETFIKEKCLVEQPFVKDPKKTIQDCINALIASIGENIYISRFARYKVNEIE